ncbi:sigma-E factor negative regulatory protein [Marinomonas sp. RSW2]|uniref:Sigma-E factor negative regulatory protein n=1 Tax=Marinomonas maritima TaxID=2940935 RepID=A0ABT5WCX4_9GAMM|nr:sigma-E factor negative regulatory protein [Marinomonas maritima]MDE8601920.1 sigma-E factor negative regulatory protein [Marinomonas maritima]
MANFNDRFPENDSPPEMLSSLSAMFDGEASEQDIERLVKGDHAALSRQLESFHLIQQTLHKDSDVAVGLQDSLVSRIRVEIDNDDTDTEKQKVRLGNAPIPFVVPIKNNASRPVWQVMLSGVAIAASVTFVIIFGGNALLTTDINSPNLMAEVRSPANNLVITPLSELNKESLLVDNVRLQNYLRQHAEQAAMTVGQGMIPMARVVSYPIQE